MAETPLLIVVSGPSGSGKGTLCKELRTTFPDMVFSISVTTRSPRSGELNGVDYFFVSQEEFLERLQKDKFLEWAKVYENYYGTLKEWVEGWLQEGRDVLLELDIQGAFQVKKKYPSTLLIFIVPPSLEELGKRINQRGEDTPENIYRRLSSAETEIKAADNYDYVIVNDQKEKAVQKLVETIKIEKKLRQVKGGAENARTQP